MPLNSNQHQAAWQQPTASKFQKWGQERDAFLKEAENANRERERVEKRMEELRAKQTELHEEILHTTNNVGRIHRDREMLTKEKARLEKVYQEEHAELAKCAKDSDDFAMKVKLEKKEYARVMQEMSGELGDLLMKQEDFRLQQLITVETLPVIVEHHKRVDASPDTDNGSLENIVMLMDPLKRKTHEMVEAMNALKEKKNTLHAIRQGVLRGSITVKGSSGKTFHKSELEELEAAWLQEGDDGEDTNLGPAQQSNNMGQPVLVQLFYGPKHVDTSSDDTTNDVGVQS